MRSSVARVTQRSVAFGTVVGSNYERLYNETIGWFTTYADSVSAAGYLVLTVTIILIYFFQTRELKRQSGTLSSQTEATRAGIQPIIEITDLSAPCEHPDGETEWESADYLLVDLVNIGNEVAIDLRIECLAAVDDEDLDISSKSIPLERTECPAIAHGSDGGVLAADSSNSFIAPVEVDVSHQEFSDSPIRFSDVITGINDPDIEHTATNIYIGFVIHYQNLATEDYEFPIRDVAVVDLCDHPSSLHESIENAASTEDFSDIFENRVEEG